MNIVDRADYVTLGEGERKVAFKLDDALPNAGTFKIAVEDHTIGNLLRAQLLKDSGVLFAGYKQPHPLATHIELKIQTKGEKREAGARVEYPPSRALEKALIELNSVFQRMQNNFRVAVKKKKEEMGMEYDV